MSPDDGVERGSVVHRLPPSPFQSKIQKIQNPKDPKSKMGAGKINERAKEEGRKEKKDTYLLSPWLCIGIGLPLTLHRRSVSVLYQVLSRTKARKLQLPLCNCTNLYTGVLDCYTKVITSTAEESAITDK